MYKQFEHLQLYKSHKLVRACKLRLVSLNRSGAILYPENGYLGAIEVDLEFVEKRLPSNLVNQTDPGYFVVYEDGYTSWSPTEAFENGYRKVYDGVPVKETKDVKIFDSLIKLGQILIEIVIFLFALLNLYELRGSDVFWLGVALLTIYGEIIFLRRRKRES